LKKIDRLTAREKEKEQKGQRAKEQEYKVLLSPRSTTHNTKTEVDVAEARIIIVTKSRTAEHNVNFGFCQVLILLICKYCQSQDAGLL
jgi:hypothetical protein